MYRTFIILVFIHLLDKALCEYFCSANSNSCPQHLPFCAAGRCVYQCASSSFINGTDCVDNCGDWYINNSLCVEKCPENIQFVHEVPLSALTTARYCYAKCPLFTYADGITCLERCPVERHLVENGTCVTNCSESLKYRYPVLDRNKKIQVNGTNLCMEKCPDGDYFVPGTNELLIYGSRYVLNNTCVKSCGTLYESNGVCVEQCPHNTKTIVSLVVKYNRLSRRQQEGNQFSSSPGRHVVCNGRCPSYWKIQNETCVDRCASGYKEVSVNVSTSSTLAYADVCVKNCPPDQPYVNFEECVSKCSVFTNGTICVSDCGQDKFVYNGTCVDQCPPNSRFISNIAKEYDDEGHVFYFGKLLHFQGCVESCPNGSLIVNKHCLTKCPPGMSLFNHTCVFQCPEPSNYTLVGSVSKCVQTCPSGYYILNTTCYEKCPKKFKGLNKTCVAVCPESHRYTMRDVVKDEAFLCVSECPQKTFYRGDTCVDHCDLVYKGICVDTCPPDHNVTLTTISSRQEVTFCVNDCSNTTYKEGTRCVRTCSENMLISNRSCVSVCPEYQPFTINFTADSRYNYVELSRTECVSTCPNATFVDGNICVQKCKANMFVVSSQKCVKHCPKDRPLLNKLDRYDLYEPYICIEKCPDEKVANGSTCIDSYDCKGFQYDGKCLQTCPDGFSEVSNQPINEYDNLECISLLGYKVVLSIASVALVVWCVSSCAFLSMREGFVNSFLWCKHEEKFTVYSGNLNNSLRPRVQSDETDTQHLLNSMEVNETGHTLGQGSITSEETEIKTPIGEDCVQPDTAECV